MANNKGSNGILKLPEVNDLHTFDELTGGESQVAGIYFYCMLDCLVDIARKVADDFFDMPHLFTRLGPANDKVPIVAVLARLHARYGNDELVLARRQRRQIYAAIFGDPATKHVDQTSNFACLRDELLETCATFVETKFGDQESLRVNVRQKHRLFREYLRELYGESLVWSKEQALGSLTEGVCYRILRNAGVAAVYGIIKPPDNSYPYNFDSNGDKLVEQITAKPKLNRNESGNGAGDDSTTRDYDTGPILREEILNRQRAAREGAIAIARVLKFDPNDPAQEEKITENTELLSRNCYTWATALGALRGGNNRVRRRVGRWTMQPGELPEGARASAAAYPRE